MIVIDYVNEDFAKVSTTETKESLLKILGEYNFSHLPLFENGNFIGNISRDNVLEIIKTNNSIKQSQFSILEHFKLNKTSTLFDAFQVLGIHKTNMIPIFDKEIFLGVVFAEDIVEAINKIPFFQNQAAIMVVRTQAKRYSINEISKIIESNNAKTLGVLVYRINNEFVDVLVKVISDNTTSLGETFERFGYQIIEKYFSDNKDVFMKDRYDHFMRYMNV